MRHVRKSDKSREPNVLSLSTNLRYRLACWVKMSADYILKKKKKRLLLFYFFFCPENRTRHYKQTVSFRDNTICSMKCHNPIVWEK